MKKSFGRMLRKEHFKYNNAYYIKYDQDTSINLKTGKVVHFSYSHFVIPVKIKIMEKK